MPIAIATTPRATPTTAMPSKYGSIGTTTSPTRRSYRRSLPTSAVVATTACEFESLELSNIAQLSPTTFCQRSVSCYEFGSDARRFRTLRLGSDELQRLAQANVAELKRTAASAAAQDSTNALLARKALRYRKIASASSDSVPIASC